MVDSVLEEAPRPVAHKWNIPVWRHLEAAPKPFDEDEVPVLVVGAGPVGLAMALDLGRRGHRVTVVSRLDFIAGGSKAICFSKRTLDIMQRLGVGEQLLNLGVTWNVGKVYWKDRSEPVFQFDMLPVKDQQYPGFINLQQYHFEDVLMRALEALPNVTVRTGHAIVGVNPHADHVEVALECPQGTYATRCQWLVACDGSRSTVRQLLGLDFEGRVFEDNFLIADIRMEGQMAPERKFWFDPPFNPGQSALMHQQPDGVWRLDFQLGWNIDRTQAAQPENVERYVRAMLGTDVSFNEEWYSVYTFQCRRMQRFVHGRVLFAGDSAHLVSPFGARGCNGGLADVDNLGWKLDRVLTDRGATTLLESYNHEAVATADENILNSTRATEFLTPKTPASRAFRDAVLELAATQSFARPFVNSGRLSTAVSYPESPLNSPDSQRWVRGVPPGSPALDAPLDKDWLLSHLGNRFVLLANRWTEALPSGVELLDVSNLPGAYPILIERYGLEEGSGYLVRPDQYVAARWKRPVSAQEILAALQKACGGVTL